MVAISGLTNAINIIDGFNGLASGTSVFILLFIAWLAHQVGDADLAEMALILMSTVLGFMLLNYPFGKIFLGDSGAYFVGFLIACLAIMLPTRNPEVSPWTLLTICAYPVWESLFSMGRRWFMRMSATAPDHLHLHTLFKTRLILRYVHSWPSWLKNSLVAPWIWFPTIVMGCVTIFMWRDTYV